MDDMYAECLMSLFVRNLLSNLNKLTAHAHTNYELFLHFTKIDDISGKCLNVLQKEKYRHGC